MAGYFETGTGYMAGYDISVQRTWGSDTGPRPPYLLTIWSGSSVVIQARLTVDDFGCLVAIN